MQNQHINFKRKRELGEIITDTFKFLRENYKATFRNLFNIAGIPFLIFVAASAYNAHTSFGSGSAFDFSSTFTAFNNAELIGSTLLVYLTAFIFLIALQACIMSVIKSYISNEGIIVDDEVKATVKERLGDIALAGIGKTILLLIGLMLCVIPGIYISVPFFLIFPILFFENKKANEVFSDCFHLVKDNWWITFATIFILGLLWYLISLVFSIPAMIYMGVKMFTSIQENSISDPSSMFDLGTIILSVIASAFQYITYIFMPIGAAFIYFNLNEQKNQTGTLEQIDRLGE